ncbi:MAG TPA: hypothetical protein V6C57_28040 [Coleofasciculaceae cyanobacterium]
MLRSLILEIKAMLWRRNVKVGDRCCVRNVLGWMMPCDILAFDPKVGFYCKSDSSDRSYSCFWIDVGQMYPEDRDTFAPIVDAIRRLQDGA